MRIKIKQNLLYLSQQKTIKNQKSIDITAGRREIIYGKEIDNLHRYLLALKKLPPFGHLFLAPVTLEGTEA